MDFHKTSILKKLSLLGFIYIKYQKKIHVGN
jgi:hypothetical protein